MRLTKRHRQILVAARSDGPEKRRLRVAAEVWWVESHWVILEMVKHGIGWAFVTDHVIASSLTAPDLVTPDLQFAAAKRSRSHEAAGPQGRCLCQTSSRAMGQSPLSNCRSGVTRSGAVRDEAMT
jgi:DNA-binding transcriptional LysR family regulator